MSLKVKVQLGEDLRIFKKANFTDLEAEYERLKLFVKESFNIQDWRKYLIQYKDEEDDLITIVSKDDLIEPIEECIENGRSLKLFIKPVKRPQAKVESDNYDSEVSKENELTGNFCFDISNNEDFRQEVISFLREIVEKYQETKGEDLIGCVVTSLSKHERISKYDAIKQFLPRLQTFGPLLTPLVGPFIQGLDASKTEEIIENILQMLKQPGFEISDLCKQFAGFSMFCANNNDNDDDERNCPGFHGLKHFDVYNNSFACDDCDCKIEKNAPAWGCRQCNYDLCVPCFSNKTVRYRRHARHGGYGPRRRHWHHGCHRHGHGHGHGHHGQRKWMKYCRGKACEKIIDGPAYRANVVSNPLPLLSNGKVDSNQGIIKTWKLKNVGEISLPKGLVVKYQGRKCNPMVTTNEFMVGNSEEIKPNEEFVVTVSVNTPSSYGSYRSNWRLFTKEGQRFGERLLFNLVLMPENRNGESKEQNDESKEQNDESKEKDDESKEQNDESKEQKNEEKQDEGTNNDQDDTDMVISDEETPEIFKYQKELENLKLMGFDYGNHFLKELLNTHQGRLDDVLGVLLSK